MNSTKKNTPAEQAPQLAALFKPPDVTLKTTAYPTGSVYHGGPMLVMPSGAAAVTAARASFPTVTIDTLVENAISTNVLLATRPTRILLIYGQWGETGETMTNMGLPFDLVNKTDVENNPELMFNYDVVIDDCPGWDSLVPQMIIVYMRRYVRLGGEVIFTDIALRDLSEQIFPGRVTVVDSVDGNWNFTYHNTGDFLSQYSGPTVVSMYTMIGGRFVSAIENPNVKIIMDSSNYSEIASYRIRAFYFTYGNGIVEGFAFHPGDQNNAYAATIASVLLGNKLIHTASTLETPTETPTQQPQQQQGVLPVTGQSSLLTVLGALLLLFGLATKLATHQPKL